MPRWPRRTVQMGALALLVLVPALNYGGVLYQQYGKNAYHTVSLMGTLFDWAVYQTFSVVAEFLPNPVENSALVVGGFGSFSLFGITFFDPVVALETLMRTPAAWGSILAGSALTLLIAVLMGRVFCGWICPVNTILEGFDTLRKRALPRLGVRPSDYTMPLWIKWALLFTGLGAAIVTDLAIWAHFLVHIQMGRDVFSLMFFGAATFGSSLLFVIIFVELFFSRRVWCRSICPTGVLLGWLGSRSLVRLRKGEAACLTDCAACLRACPMALRPAEPIQQAECMNCSLCVSACPADLLHLLPRFSPNSRLTEASPVFKRIAVFILVFTGAFLFVSTAAAHHMRGLPHYGYTENYPQTPTKETHARMAGFKVTVVSYFFGGIRRERANTPDDVQLYISLANAKTHQSYTGPLSIEIWRDKRRIARFDHARPFEEAVYRIRQAVPGPGQYELRLTAGETSGRVLVDIEGDAPARTPYFVAGLALLVGALFLLNRRRLRLGTRGKSHVASGA